MSDSGAQGTPSVPDNVTDAEASTNESDNAVAQQDNPIYFALEHCALFDTRHAGEVQLFRGRLANSLVPQDERFPHNAIYKVAYGLEAIKVLYAEGSFYMNQLKPLQGDAVPRCFGFLAGDDFVSRKSVACLVLEDCGKPVDGVFRNQTHEMKQKIMNAVVKLHDAGITHGNLEEDNVLEDEHGRISIIDFDIEWAKVGHQCHRTRNPVVGELACYPQSFYCDEIWNFCERMGLWKPNQIEYYGTYYNIKLASDVFKLASFALEDQGDCGDGYGGSGEPWCSEEEAIREAFRVNIDYAKEYGDEFHDAELIVRHETLLKELAEWEESVKKGQAAGARSSVTGGPHSNMIEESVWEEDGWNQ
ncbi:hypothetical protein DENSPDRAFT_815960 [Dentipellis sp. KUC8613]|nr:hypothetical protein DENSPDRAFT_815960 [Dentipellis sp. KUC8613]